VIRPTVDGMAAEGNAFTGFLYAGLMISKTGELKVLEYNVRFGDPETQPIMMRMQSDLVELCLAAVDGKLNEHSAQWDSRFALGVVLAAGGYPYAYNKGDVISGLDDADTANAKIFHAGTVMQDDNVVTMGGRVLCACGMGDTVAEAQKTAYELVDKIQWKDIYYRKDIGFKAL